MTFMAQFTVSDELSCLAASLLPCPVLSSRIGSVLACLRSTRTRARLRPSSRPRAPTKFACSCDSGAPTHAAGRDHGRGPRGGPLSLASGLDFLGGATGTSCGSATIWPPAGTASVGRIACCGPRAWADGGRSAGGEAHAGAGGVAGPGHAGAELWMGTDKREGEDRGILVIFVGWSHMSGHD